MRNTLKLTKSPEIPAWRFIASTFAFGLATFLDALDLSILNVSLPSIMSSLGQRPFDGVWVLTSYAIGNALTMAITGRLAKKFGAINLILYSLTGFVIFSALCGSAINFHDLVLFRFLQGICAGPLIPLSQRLIQTYSPPSKRDIAYSIWSVIAMSAVLIGPLLGGWISQFFGWRWLFYINLPAGILTICIIFSLLRREAPQEYVHIDWPGFFLLALSIICLQIGLDKGNDLNWFDSNLIISLLCVAAVAFISFFIWTKHALDPIVHLELFKIRNFALAAISSFVAFMCMNAQLIIYPLWLETNLGYTPLWAAYALIPTTVPTLIIVPFLILILRPKNIKFIAIMGLFITALGFWDSSLQNNAASYAALVRPRLILGIGYAFLSVPLMSLATSDVSDELHTAAISIITFFRIFTVAIGSALGIAFVQHTTKLVDEDFSLVLSPENLKVKETLALLESKGMTTTQSIAWIQEQVNSQSFTVSINNFFLFLSLIIILVIPLIVAIKTPKKLHKLHAE